MNQNLLFVIILLMACFSQVAADIYLPSISSITEYYNTDINLVQFTLVIFTFGICIMQLISGPLSEIIGRKKPLLIGFFVSIIGTIICIFSPNIYCMLLGRFIQGLGAGAGAGQLHEKRELK